MTKDGGNETLSVWTILRAGRRLDSLSVERTAEKIGWVRDAAGARFDSLELNMLASEFILTDDRRSAARASLARRKLPTDDAAIERWLDTPPN